MELFGPMMNLWEVSNQGEGYLRYVKPKIHTIKSKNWHINAHKKILEDIAFDRTINTFRDDIAHGTKSAKSSQIKTKKMYRYYESVCELLYDLKTNNVISYIRTKENKYKAIIRFSYKRSTEDTCSIFIVTFRL